MATPTPIRPAEEVVGALVPIILGGKVYQLAELPRRANREWQGRLKTDVHDAIDNAGPMDTIEDVMDAIAGAAELWMDLLIAYDECGAKAWDRTSVLPDREWIDTHATDRECYEGIRKVTGVSFPFGRDVLQVIPELRPMLLQAVSKGVAAAAIAIMTSSQSLSSALPSTAGDPTTSKPASLTRSSSPTSTKRSSAGRKPPKSSSTASPSP